jgi:hypothetical protein
MINSAVAQLVEALRYKPKGRGVQIPKMSVELFLAALWPWVRLIL